MNYCCMCCDDLKQREEEANIVVKYEPMVHKLLIGRAYSCLCEYDDLLQEGRLAILNAYRNYDESIGVDFDGWVSINIKNALAQYQKETTYSLSRFEHMRQTISTLSKKLEKEEIEVKDLVANGVKENTAKAAIAGLSSRITEELKEDMGSDSSDELFVDSEARLTQLMKGLEMIEKKVIYLIYGFSGECLSRKETAKVLNTTEGVVRAVLQRALNKLRCMKDILAFSA